MQRQRIITKNECETTYSPPIRNSGAPWPGTATVSSSRSSAVPTSQNTPRLDGKANEGYESQGKNSAGENLNGGWLEAARQEYFLGALKEIVEMDVEVRRRAIYGGAQNNAFAEVRVMREIYYPTPPSGGIRDQSEVRYEHRLERGYRALKLEDYEARRVWSAHLSNNRGEEKSGLEIWILTDPSLVLASKETRTFSNREWIQQRVPNQHPE